ncbi:lysozyme family protein [Nocardioides bizhenqiangii]|uniref:Transglycosylase SLT domain-containing protein n=1 Tax=Nocardioides bizhenqiangii TaxID=3095076 RepID=A0ABZ0ZUD6_9ACTN|nr:hypothetical protein [Nocardioides sp. HM61]WQQ27675.1 hypothetical protein SHK19_05420 [Nocardioides sp. HM61]
MAARHRNAPVRSGSAVRRAVLTSVLSALALTSVTITAAAVTLTNATPRAEAPSSADATTTATTEAELPLAPPVEVQDVPVGIPDVAVVVADGVQLDAVPSTALAAYQRAAAVLGSADKRCHLEWTLVAAVGHVVSGHGTTAGSELDESGRMRPQYAGKPLVGRDGKRIPDSDAGRLDGDGRFDRPVGPLQLSPATWAVVGVDSDDDGRRNPHDIDDAALAVSVLLCSGDDDLRRRAGRIDAVRRINDDRTFIETVLATDRAYRTQMSQSYDSDPVVIPADTPVDVPTDLPTNVPVNARNPVPSDGPTASDPPSATATDPVTWSPSPNPPSSTHPPRDPTDRPDPSCPTDTDEPTDEASTELTDTATPEPTDTATAAPTDSPTDATDPTDAPTELPTDDRPGCEDDADDDETD